MFQTVKLNRLRLSVANIRKTADDLIEQLAADISARGILQNLLVTPVRRPRGAFAVFAGGRRFRALMLLAERGEIAARDYDVPVQVLKGDDATLSETSLAENFQRLAMSPADECRAFQHFVGVDGDLGAVAKRFGITRRFVEGRLRLANLAEPIFQALSSGEITLDIAKAYASTESHDKQLLVWENYGQNGYATPDMIRRVITNESMKSTDAVALLVGEDAYAAAGGRVDRDLFSDAGDRWIDPEIAQRLAADLMEREARRLGEEEGLAWIRPVASSNTWNAAADLFRVPLPAAPFSEEEAARLEAIDARFAAIELEMDDESLTEDAQRVLEEEAEALAEESRALHRRPSILPEELKPLVGTFLVLMPDGEMRLDSVYYSESPLPTGDDDGGDATGACGSYRVDRADGGSPPPERLAPGGKPLSQTLYDQLAMQRRDILAASLLAQPALALDLALFAMTDAKQRHGAYGTTIRAPQPHDPLPGSNVPASRARDYLAEALDGLDAGWTERHGEVERFEAFRALDDEAKAGWLAYIVATSLEAKPAFAGAGVGQDPLQNRLASILAIDVASWWRPTSENFFDRVSKGALLTLLDAVGGPALSSRHAGEKKADISASCQRLFAGDAIVEPEVREAALAWVPSAMLFLDEARAETPGEVPASDDVEGAPSASSPIAANDAFVAVAAE